MKTFYKYPLRGWGNESIELPVGARITSAQCQGDRLCLWALVDTEAPVELVEVHIYGTGFSVSKVEPSQIFTVQDTTDRMGVFVWHVCIFQGGDDS